METLLYMILVLIIIRGLVLSYRVVTNFLLIKKLVKKYGRKIPTTKFVGYVMLSNAHGQYNINKNMVRFNYKLLLEKRYIVISTVVHEYRHALQYTSDLYLDLAFIRYAEYKGYIALNTPPVLDKVEYYSDPIEIDALGYGWKVSERLGLGVDTSGKMKEVIYENRKRMLRFINVG